MDAIRAFVQTLLPFEFMQFDFMVNALLAILLLTPLLGLLGTMAVNQQMAFFSDALGHSALTGIGLGILLGVSSDLLAMLVFGIVWALLICRIKQTGAASTDTIISVFSSTSVAAAGAVHGRWIREVFVPARRRRAGGTGQRPALSVDCACGGHCAVGGDVQFAAAVGHQPVPGAQPRHP